MLKRDPALYLYESEQSFRASAGHWKTRIDAGFKSPAVTAAEIRDLEPNLAPIFTNGVISEDWAIVTDPIEVVQGIFAAGQGKGVTYRRAKVTAIAGTAVVADGNRLPFDAVLITAGVWSKPLAASLGETLPVEAERGYNVTYPNPAASVRRPLVLADRGVVVTALKPGLRLGGWTELGGTELPPNPARWRKMREITDAVLPGLRCAPAKEWMGHRPSMPDSIPVISRSTRNPAVFYALGHGHYGLSWSAKTARLIGELIAGETSDATLAAYSMKRWN
jgi:D-amino-acid dehydrogenase